MGAFRKKPVVIQAVQWHKHGDHPQVRPLADSDDLYFTGMGGATLTLPLGREAYGVIGTLESPNQLVTPGDWIITGVKGEHYPCKPDVFAETYEAAENGAHADGNALHQVSLADVEAAIASEHYGTAADLGDTGVIKAGSHQRPSALPRVTLCTLVLKNGFPITGTNHAAFAPNFDAERGRQEARADAIRQLRAFMVFALRDRIARGLPA